MNYVNNILSKFPSVYKSHQNVAVIWKKNQLAWYGMNEEVEVSMQVK